MLMLSSALRACFFFVVVAGDDGVIILGWVTGFYRHLEI
jgi:hypothetical protein